MGAVNSRDAQDRANTWLRVAVYRAEPGWVCAVQVMRSGRPHPRLLRQVSQYPVAPAAASLSEALKAASTRLWDAGVDLEP